MLQDMKDSGVQRNVWVYSSMVAALVRQQDVPGAQSMVEEMRADGVVPTTVVFNTLLQAYADSEAAVARVCCSTFLWVLNRVGHMAMGVDGCGC